MKTLKNRKGWIKAPESKPEEKTKPKIVLTYAFELSIWKAFNT